jgi:hypothetical protein
MGDYVLEIYPALERLIERASAPDEYPLPDEFVDAFCEDNEDPVHIAENACKQSQLPVGLLESRVERCEPYHSTPSALSSQVSVNAGRKKARHKKQSPRQTNRSLRKVEHETRKAERSSKKAAAADRRLELSLHDQKSFFGPTTKQWRLMVAPDLDRVSSAQRRFAISLSHGKAVMLSAANELDAATRDAMTWLTAHPCPDSNLGDQVAGLVNTCAEVADTSRCSVATPFADTHAVMTRLGALLGVIDRQVQKLDAW